MPDHFGYDMFVSYRCKDVGDKAEHLKIDVV